MNKYFAYSNDLGTEFFETEQEAIDWCEDEIQFYRDQAGLDEWSDEVESVCYGKIIAKSFEQVIDEEHSDFKLENIKDEN